MGTACHSVSGNPATILSPAIAPISSLKAHFLPIWGGSGTPSPTNVRPISGRTGLTVYKSGGNVLPFESVLTEGYTNTVDGVTATYSKGVVTMTGTHSVSGWSTLLAFNTVWASNPIVLPAGTYNFSRGSDNGQYSTFCVCCRIDGGSLENKSAAITATQSVTVLGFYVAVYGEGTVDSTMPLVMAPGEDRPTRYEPYVPIETINADWASAGTVYGGSYDIATGDLKSDYRMWTKNSSEMNRESDTFPGWNQCGIKNVVGEIDSSLYPGGGVWSYLNCGTRIAITTTGVADNAYLPRQTYGLTEAEWKALAIDVQFCYHLSTSDDVATLTPQTLSTFRGVTKLWCATGDIDVEYEVADSVEMVKAKKRVAANAPHLVYDTSSTAVKKFSTDMKSPLKNCAIAVGPTQEGSGDPALDNRRNIVGYDKFGLRHTGKNLYRVIGFSCDIYREEENISNFTTSNNVRGTTLSTCRGNSVAVTQSLYNPDEPKESYKNGCFGIAFHRMTYNKTYNISFDIVDILSNPLNASLSDIRFVNPFGSKSGNVTADGNRVIVRGYYHKKYANDNRFMVQVYNCGMSFTLTNIMVTDENETDQTFEPFVPVLGKNIGVVAGYSTNQRGQWRLTNDYGTTVNRTDFVFPDTPLIITQSTASSSYEKYSYRNGYFSVDVIGLEFGKRYNISFKVTNIVSNPLDATLNNLRIATPNGSHYTANRIDGNRVFFDNVNYLMSESYPQTTAFDVRNCGMSFTMSEFMVTEAGEDQTYAPCIDNEYVMEFPETLYAGGCDPTMGTLILFYAGKTDVLSNYSAKTVYDNGYTGYEFDFVPYAVKTNANQKCDILPYLWQDQTGGTAHFYAYTVSGTSTSKILLYVPTGTDESTQWTAIAELTYPAFYQLDSQQIKTLRGNNVFSVEGNSAIGLRYWTH